MFSFTDNLGPNWSTGGGTEPEVHGLANEVPAPTQATVTSNEQNQIRGGAVLIVLALLALWALGFSFKSIRL